MVTESFLPSRNGVTTSVLRVLDHLAAGGHEALVVCPGPAPDRYAGFAVRGGFAVSYRGFPVGLPTARLTGVLEDFAPDVLHAASPFLLGAQAVTVAARLGVPSVAVFQTDVAGFARRHRLPLAPAAAWRWLRRVHAAADLTLAPSRQTVADLAAHGVPRVRLWARGVDAVGFHPRHRDHPVALGMRREAGDRLLVGYVGRLAPEKRVERLSAVARLAGVRVVVVGDGPSRGSVTRALTGTDAVLLGQLSGDELAAAYAALDVFVHTGTEETFGQTLQEAMASRVPVVAPAAGGPLDVVGDGVTGVLYPAEDDDALAQAVARLVAEPLTRARMGEAGRRAVLPRSWDARCAELLVHYAEAATTRRARASVRDSSLRPLSA